MITYRTTGPWGPGAGANLTPAQVDGNFYDVAQRVQYLEMHGIQPVQITSFQAVGNQLYIYMSDGTVNGPLLLPEVRWFFRGNWLPNTVYALNDVVAAPDSGIYLVIRTHTSGTAFSENANDGQGHNFYSLLMRPPAAVLPVGGLSGHVLTKNSSNNFDVAWKSVPPPAGGLTNQVLMKISDADRDAGWGYFTLDNLYDVLLVQDYPLRDGDYLRWSATRGQWTNQPRPIFNVVTSTSWDPVVGDEGSFMVLTNGTTATNIIIPNNTTQPFAVGSELHIHQDGTGRVTIVGEEGVTLRYHASFAPILAGQYATATVKKTATNVWRLFGLLAGPL